jgi:hypothetical protein
MELKNASRKWKVGNTTTYYFENDNGIYAIINVTKLKSGYEVEIDDIEKDIYKRTDGLRNMEQVNKYIKDF